jgi:hypothetical protein
MSGMAYSSTFFDNFDLPNPNWAALGGSWERRLVPNSAGDYYLNGTAAVDGESAIYQYTGDQFNNSDLELMTTVRFVTEYSQISGSFVESSAGLLFGMNASAGYYAGLNLKENGHIWLWRGDFNNHEDGDDLGAIENFWNYFFRIMIDTSIDHFDVKVEAGLYNNPNGVPDWQIFQGRFDADLSGTGYTGLCAGDDSGEGANFGRFSVTENPVPEPATMVLFGFGLLGLAGFSRRKN